MPAATNVSYNAQLARGGRIAAVVASTLLLTVLALALSAPVLAKASALGATLLVITMLVFGFVLMIWGFRRWGSALAAYVVDDAGVREEVRAGGRTLRVRALAWDDIEEYRAGVKAVSGIAYLELRGKAAPLHIRSVPGTDVRSEFSPLRELVVSHLEKRGVPRAAPSAFSSLWPRVLGAGMLVFLVGILGYVLLLPAGDRPDQWWLRWLFLAAVSSALIGKAFQAKESAPSDP